ncbi:type I-U CRISPR-associated helicase/endonuclease Cas3 [Maioricimonas sp. JC845]|uniref:type I-G CRISPR-associated helicase/endonuclease Cas3g n=1 Tax=Maioricimonas sp. JC845 TaxID=3232138 RepID=UPI003458DE63
MSRFSEALGLKENESPFPWQERLLDRFVEGIGTQTSLDIPTGLGKTSVIAAWLVARSQGAALPRRLVYVVDRRAVVDQATREAERLRAWLDDTPDVKTQLGLTNSQSLPISTLRGQHVDNREWLDDPSVPAIIVGTVDMIGSRLLFEGYGISRKMRSYHAGLLGTDTLLVLDEAHLVPPFEMMLQTLATQDDVFGSDSKLDDLIPRLKLLSLSATGRSAGGEVLRLTDADQSHCIARRRLEATKRLSFRESDGSKSLPELLAEEAWSLAEQGRLPVRVIVFSHHRDVAQKAKEAIEKRARGDKKQGVAPVRAQTGLLVGARRVHEREQARTWLETYGFLAGSGNVSRHPTFLFATSAGEVGVDLDADHMVCDLVQWERMVQRLGRVNRRGDGRASVRVIVEWIAPTQKQTKAIAKPTSDRNQSEAADARKYADAVNDARRDPKHKMNVFRAPLCCLPSQGDAYDASPGAIRHLKLRADEDEQLQAAIQAATSVPPLRPALTRPVVDAWSMTSLEKHTGRPMVAPWLRGWVDDEPQTTVIWRRYLPVRENSSATENKRKADATEFFEHAPPHLSEMLEAQSQQVSDWLTKRAKATLKTPNESPAEIEDGAAHANPLTRDSVVAIVLGRALEVVNMLKLRDLDVKGDDKKALQGVISNGTLVVDERFGGLSTSGLLDDKAHFDDQLTGDDAAWEATGFRVRRSDDGLPSQDERWRTSLKFVSRTTDEGEPLEWLLVEKQQALPTSEDARAIARTEQPLSTHQQSAEREAGRIASRLDLPREYTRMLTIAARLHDEGKRSARWQNAFSAPQDGRPYAKTEGPVKARLLDGYRHEFGSLPIMMEDREFQTLSPDLQELALHLVAAHHGFARPVIRTSGCEDAPPSALEGRARDVALRFARLQQRWGPWGLAWWESLLRAADQRVSRLLDESSSKHAASDEEGGEHTDG